MPDPAVCVDACLVVKWLVAEPDSFAARDLARRWRDSGVSLLAPALLPFEVTNVLWQQRRKRDLTSDEAFDALRDLWSLSIGLHMSDRLCEQALIVAEQFGLKSAYDAQYVALAVMEGCHLWTADRKLYDMLSGRDAPIRFFDESPAP